MKRDEMISKLIASNLEFGESMFYEVLKNGFRGYKQMTDKELREEIKYVN